MTVEAAPSNAPSREPSDAPPGRSSVDAGPSPCAFSVRLWHVACLSLIVLVGAALRWHQIERTSVWCDELLSIHISNAHDFSVDRLPRGTLIGDVPDLMSLDAAQPAWKVWARMGGDMHPPLYYQTLRFWREAFGDSPAGIRSLSALLGTLALVAIFFAGRELGGTVAGLWVTALNAVAANHVYYSQEARMYAFVLLWAGIAIALTLRVERLGFTRRRGAALALVSWGAMLTLYLSSAVLLAAAIYAAVRLRGRDRAGVLLSFVAAAAGFAVVWVPFLLGQHFHAMKSDWLKADPAGHVATTLGRLLLLPMNQFGVPLPSGDAYGYAFAIVYLLPALFVRRAPKLLLPWLAALFVIAFPAVADLLRTTNMLMWARYTVLLIPTLSLVIVGLSWQLSNRVRWAVPLSMVLFGALSLPALYARERYDFRNTARVAEQAHRAGEGRVVLLSTWNEKFNSVLLLAMQYYWAEPPRDVVFVESTEALLALDRAVTTDRVILFAGDRNADLDALPGYVIDGRQTWAVGVGSVTSLRRLPAAATTHAGIAE